MITEYNAKYNNNINKMDLQNEMCHMFAKQQQLLVKINNVHSELIKIFTIDPYTLFQEVIDLVAISRRF
jgi:hypothetical protein